MDEASATTFFMRHDTIGGDAKQHARPEFNAVRLSEQ
jgi:hypothetical protein